MTVPSFHVIVACSLDNGIGVGSRLPWKLPRDLAYFERVTRGVRASVYPPGCRNAIIMGRLTYMSIPARARPLANRLNVVLTNDAAFIARQVCNIAPKDILTAPTLDDALAQLATRTDVADVYIGGGTRVYAEAVEHPHCEQVFLTRVHQTIPECTAHFPALFGAELDVITKAGWRRASHAELKAWLDASATALPDGPATGTEDDATLPDDYPEGQLRDEKSNVAFEFQLFTRCRTVA